MAKKNESYNKKEKKPKKEKANENIEGNNNLHKYLWYVIIFSLLGLVAEILYGFVITKKGFKNPFYKLTIFFRK